VKKWISQDSWNIPIYNAIRKYTDSLPIPFHMPGHKLGQGLPDKFIYDIARLDLTEIHGTDNLHHPSGPIMEAQRLAASAFGADRTYFLVNGSTCGIHAAISTVCKPGDSLIVGRNCHKAVIGGMMLAGVKPIYMLPEYNEDFSIISDVLPGSVKKALESNPDAASVLITSPNYYGICSDLKIIAEVVHAHGKPLLVDEAHGAHLKFNLDLPVCATDAGADISIQSAHKTLPAFTQGAYLHVRNGLVDTERLEYFLDILQTSSPSYVIMSFLDIAREIMQDYGEDLLGNLLDNVRALKEKSSFKGLRILSRKDMLRHENGSSACCLDETRLVFNFRDLGITGYEAEEILRKRYRIQVEMSDLYNVVCITVPSDVDGNLESLFRCLGEIDGEYSGKAACYESGPAWNNIIPEQKISLRDTVDAPSEKVSLSRASGRISKVVAAPYPPGIPALCPGEVILPETVKYLLAVLHSGGKVDGVDDNLEISVVRQ